MGKRRRSDYDSTRDLIETVYRHLTRHQGGCGLDFVHEAMLKLALKIRSGANVDDPAAYARTVASREKVNERRKETVHARYERAIAHDVESCRREAALADDEASQTRALIEQYRAELDEIRSQVLTLHFEENLSAAEVARRLRRPPRTVSKWVGEMRRELVARFARSEDFS